MAHLCELPTQSNDDLFHQLDVYPWEYDPEFQSGLRAILGTSPSSDQAEHLTLRARCFYFSRKNNIPIDFDEYKDWRTQYNSQAPSNNKSPPDFTSSGTTMTAPATPSISSPTSTMNAVNMAPSTSPPGPYPTTFNHIVELITKGEPVPGIKEIPDTVLTGQDSQPTTAKRRKPWEQRQAEEVSILDDKRNVTREER
ncbi:hypothetical protein MMC12_008122 [Toensbergia leucococca]|nr:hypothetical protein [Toensbergia leucococca]